MSWARYDDNFDDHPKVGQAIAEEPSSITLHTCANTYAHRNGTDGWVPPWYPRRLLGPRGPRAARALVNSDLWEPATERGGWFFHDWEDYASPDERRHRDAEGPPKTDPELIEKRREWGRLGGKRSGAARRRAAEAPKPEASSIEASDASDRSMDASSIEAPEASQVASQSEATAKHPEPEPVRAGEASDASASKLQASAPGVPAPGASPVAQEDWPRPPLGPHVDPYRSAVLDDATAASRNGSGAAHATDVSSQAATTQRLVDEWADSHPKPPTKTSRRWMANAVREQVANGETEADVRAGLRALRAAQDTGADVGPGLLAKFIDQAKNPPAQRSQPAGQRLSYDPNATVSYGNNDEPGSKPMTIDEWRNEGK